MTKLPIIELPEYECELPVKNTKVKFKPYTIQEEKIFLTAQEENKKNYIDSILKITKDCVIEPEDFEIDNFIDFVYLFSYIRAKSKGEKVEGTVYCEKCGHQTPVSIDLIKNLKIHNKKTLQKLITIDNKLGIEFKVPSIDVFKEVINDELSEIDEFVAIIISMVNKILFDKKVYEDFTTEDLKENIFNRMTESQYQKIVEGISKMINLRYEYTINCIKCGHQKDVSEGDYGTFFDF